MLFHIFNSQEERRAFGGSGFIEIQYCRHPMDTKPKRILNNVTHWSDDSLYVDLPQFKNRNGRSVRY